jgi:hypothetical protein
MTGPRRNVIPLHAPPRLGPWIEAVAGALPAPLLLLRPDRTLLYANAEGSSRLRRGDVLRLRGPRVVAADPAQEAAWCAACARAKQSRHAVRWRSMPGNEAAIVTVGGDDDRALLWVQLPGPGGPAGDRATSPTR